MSPIPSFADDLAYVLQDVGEVVVYGTQQDYGLLNETAFDRTDPAGFEIRGTLYSLVVRDGAFTGLAEDATIVHDGTAYTIRDRGNARTDGTRALIVTKGMIVAPAVDHLVIALPAVDHVTLAVAA